MKNLYLILLLLILIFCTGFSNQEELFISVFLPNIDKLENTFKSYIPLKNEIVYTKVPRGLIISIDEKIFFSKGDARIKESSLYILNSIADVLKEIDNYCVIENHTEENVFDKADYTENWELSIVRSGNIVQYLTLCKRMPIEKIFALGYGEFMPFKDNVAPTNGMNNRVDFVIIDYEAKR